MSIVSQVVVRPICTVDEGTVPVVCEGGGRKYDFESLLEQAGKSADDSKKTSNVRDLIFTKADYQFEKMAVL